MLAKFSGVECERTKSKLRKRKEKCCALFLLHKAGHVAIVQQQLGNAQKSVMHMQICCFANANPILFSRLNCRRRC